MPILLSHFIRVHAIPKQLMISQLDIKGIYLAILAVAAQCLDITVEGAVSVEGMSSVASCNHRQGPRIGFCIAHEKNYSQPCGVQRYCVVLGVLSLWLPVVEVCHTVVLVVCVSCFMFHRSLQERNADGHQ